MSVNRDALPPLTVHALPATPGVWVSTWQTVPGYRPAGRAAPGALWTGAPGDCLLVELGVAERRWAALADVLLHPPCAERGGALHTLRAGLREYVGCAIAAVVCAGVLLVYSRDERSACIAGVPAAPAPPVVGRAAVAYVCWLSGASLSDEPLRPLLVEPASESGSSASSAAIRDPTTAASASPDSA